jgi:Domain of unknown function (DUF4265)
VYELTRLGRLGINPEDVATALVCVEAESTAREEVPVEMLGNGRVRVLATPGLAQGFAADDVIELDDGGAIVSVERAGNIGVQLLAPQHERSHVLDLAHEVEDLGGWLDGVVLRVVALTLPVSVGFPAIESLIANHVRRVGDGLEWFYSNVYDIDGNTPLNWWAVS